ESLQLGGRGGQVQRRVVPLVPEGCVESADREREPVPHRHDSGDVEAVKADLGLNGFRSELLDAGAGARTAERGIEAMAVPVPVALDLDARAGKEPGSENPVHPDGELIETKIDPRRFRRQWRTAGEFRHDLDVRVVIRRADEESGHPETGDLQRRGSRLAVEDDLAFLCRGREGDAADE